MRKIDAFSHIFPAPFFERLRAAMPEYPKSPIVVAEPSLFDLEERFRVMDRFDDYLQVLLLQFPPIDQWANGPKALELARLANDCLAELVAKHPDRFVGFAGTVVLEQPDAAVAELDRIATQLGGLGVQIYTSVNGHPLDEPRFEAFFAKAAELGKVIWLHPTRMPWTPDYPSETLSKYGLFLKLGWPYETAVSMSRLILSGILDRNPGLRILTHHAGGIIPFVAGRLVYYHDQPELRRYIQAGEVFDERHVLDCYKRFYGDTAFSGDPNGLGCALGFFGDDHILFGTDFPHGRDGGAMFIRETIATVEAAAGDQARQRKIFHENAEKLFGIVAS